MPQTTAINWILIFLALLALIAMLFANETPFFTNNNTHQRVAPRNIHLPW